MFPRPSAPYGPLSREVVALDSPIYESMNPDATLAELRRTSPVHFDEERGGWRVLRYDDVRRVLRDSATFSSKVPWPELVPIYLFMDEPEHGYYRKMTEHAFRDLPARVADIEATANRCVDEMIGKGTVDLAADVANRVPARTVAQFLGVPPDDEDRFYEMFAALDTGRLEMLGSGGEFYEYFVRQLEIARKRPRGDLISHLAQVGETHGLGAHELVGVCVQILGAGIATTRHLITWFFVLTGEGERDAIRADGSLLPSAIEETLRFRPPLNTTYRIATRPVTLCGQDIPAGALILPTVVSANHDETVFDDPDRFDIRRRPNPHLSFSEGPHLCQGAGLARLEARVTIRTLLERLSAIDIVDPDALEMFPGLNYGVKALPVTVTRRTAPVV